MQVFVPPPAYMHQVIVFIALYQDWLRDREHGVNAFAAQTVPAAGTFPLRGAFLRSRRDRWDANSGEPW